MSDNPHHMTPKEALKKVCPFMSYRFSQSNPHSNERFAETVVCNGPGCMAWRWASVPDDDENNPNGWVYSTTHGYCGMVPL